MSEKVEVYLVASANEPATTNFQRTVLDGVESSTYQQYTDYRGDDPAAIWGITEGRADRYSPSKGDILLFYTGMNENTGKRQYKYRATIQGTEWNSDMAGAIWTGRTADPAPDWPLILYLTDVREINIDSRSFHDDIGYEDAHLQDFRRLIERRRDMVTNGKTILKYLDEISGHQKSVGPESRFDAESNPAPEVDDEDEQAVDATPPKKVRSEVSRYIRNTTMVEQLKKEYEHRCQVCGDQRRGSNGDPYAEGHHLQPLGADEPGPDVEENIVILCPNHHSDFDYGRIKIDPDTLEITHSYEDLDQDSLLRRGGHELEREFIEYNNRHIAGF